MIALGVGCLPGRSALCGMLTYNLLGTIYFAWLAINGMWAVPLLWPVVALHGDFSFLLGRVWLGQRKSGKLSN